MRSFFLLCLSAVALLPADHCLAETEISMDGGVWMPFLPDYTAASVVNGFAVQQADLFRDDQSDAGAQLGLSGLRRLAILARKLEFDLGIAGVGDMGFQQQCRGSWCGG